MEEVEQDIINWALWAKDDRGVSLSGRGYPSCWAVPRGPSASLIYAEHRQESIADALAKAYDEQRALGTDRLLRAMLRNSLICYFYILFDHYMLGHKRDEWDRLKALRMYKDLKDGRAQA